MFKGMQGMQGVMKQAQQMQQKMEEAQKKIAASEHAGSSGAGMVTVLMTGEGYVKKVTLDPKSVDPSDIEMLEDVITAAFNDARTKIEAYKAEEMGKVTAGMSLPGGMKLPF